MESKNGLISFLRAAHLILYVFRGERFYDLGDAALGQSHAGAGEVVGGD